VKTNVCYLDRILGVKWYDKITNAAIKETTGLTDLPSLIADRRHSLWSHLPIIQGYTCFTSIYQLMPSFSFFTGTPPTIDWKGPPGRPRRTWVQQMEDNMGQPISACHFATLDRSLWRSLRPSSGQAQQWVSECSSAATSVLCCKISRQVTCHKRDSGELFITVNQGWQERRKSQ